MTEGNGHAINNSDLYVLKEILMKRGQGAMISPGRVAMKSSEPTVTITEQPKQRGLRFRYKCEGRSAGSIPGETSTNEKKTYPSIKISNFEGQAAIVVVSCVTKDKPFQPHPHNLVGQDCRDGVCTVKVKNPTAIISFPNIGIQCCKRHDVDENLKVREQIRVDPYGTGYPSSNANIDLNSVRLCFQVFLPDANKKFTRIVQPVVSQPIIDKKSIHDLVICRLSRQSGYASGGDEVFLLCEKINKDDIQVRFYQESNDGVSWEALGEFSPNDVHRQYAIVFKTPPYENQNIQEPISVFIQLRRPSDDEVGDPKPFQYIPLDPDPYGVNQKRKRKEIIGSMSTNQRQIPSTVNEEGSRDDQEFGENLTGAGSRLIKNRLKEKAEKGLLKNKMQNCMEMRSEMSMEPPKYSIINNLSHAEIVSLLQSNSLQASPSMGDLQNSIILIDQSNSIQMQPLTLSAAMGGQDRAPISELLSGMNYMDNVITYSGESLPQLSGLSDILPSGASVGDLNVGAHEMVTEDALQPKQEQPDSMYNHC